MEFEVGSVLTGKVTSIAKFGAFVSVAPGRSGLVHISEIANSFVSNVSDFLKEGQEVSVKVISIDDAGRVNLSIKQALPAGERRDMTSRHENAPQKPAYTARSAGSESVYSGAASSQTLIQRPEAASEATPAKSADEMFEDKLKRFMKDSDSKISGLFSDRRTRRRSRG